MKNMKREILETRYVREDAKLHLSSFLFRNTMNRFDDKSIKDVFLAMRYLNAVMETAINKQEITENDLSENNRSKYLAMKEAISLGDVLEKLIALLPDENLSEGSE